MRTALLLLPLILTTSAGAAPGGVPAPAPAPGAFAGAPNGYADLVLAGKALLESKLFARTQATDATLALKREALLDRPVSRALALLKRGLSKEVASPRPEATAEQIPSELGSFRQLGRLLQMQQYVYLADGRNAEALQSARTALRLGRAVRTDSLLTALVGVSMSAGCLRTLGDHLDRLSAPDCETLFLVCREWLAQGDPLPPALEAERKVGRTSLEAMKAKAAQEPGAHKDVLESFFTQAQKQLDEFYSQLQTTVQQPPWKRAPLTLPESHDENIAGLMVSTLIPALQKSLDTHTREEAQVKLLACHAAIRRYRWENDKLPPSLEELQLGDLALDPFTGAPLRYEPSGTRYRLFSAGPKADADDDTAVNGRKPVFVGPAD